MSLDQLMYEWVFDTLNGEVTAGIVRRDFADGMQSSPPRVTYIPLEPSESVAGGAVVYNGVLQIRIEAERPAAFGDGDNPEHAGVLHTLEDAVNTLIEGAVPTLSGYTARALKRVRTRDGQGSTDIAARTLVYEYQIFSGFAGVPLAGDEGTLSLTGYTGQVMRWEIDELAPLNADNTGYDDAYPKYELGDKTAGITIWFMPQETGVMFPALGATTASFQIHDGASFTDTIKINSRRWGQRVGSPNPVELIIRGRIDDDSSPFLTGVIS